MNDRAVQLFLKLVPHSKVLRKLYNKQRVSYYRAHILPEEEYAEAEKDAAKKKALINKYTEKKPKYLERIRSELGKLMDEKSDPATFEDAVFCCLAYGFLPYEYFSFNLKERSNENRHSFLSEYRLLELCKRMNDCYDSLVFKYKTQTYQLLKEYFHRDAMEFSADSDYSGFMRFIDGKKEFIKKGSDGAFGRGIELIQLAPYAGEEKRLFKELRAQGELLLEEKVEQSEEMASFHPASLNTVRFIAFQTLDGVEIPFCFMKTGRNGSVVDNAGSGGVMFGIDAKTGVGNTNGFDEMGKEYLTHPNSGKTFRGFQLPDFDEALEMCRECMKKTPTVKYIGWDLAHTDQGWVLVEGNHLSQMVGPQTTNQRGFKKEFEDMVRKTGVKL